MIVVEIEYTSNFVKELKKLPKEIVLIAAKKESIFKKDPLHPSLRLHELQGKLRGLWSISINRNYRIIFERMDGGCILFHSIGKHDIYKSLKK